MVFISPFLLLSCFRNRLTSTFYHLEQSEWFMQITNNQQNKSFHSTQHDNKTDLLDGLFLMDIL